MKVRAPNPAPPPVLRGPSTVEAQRAPAPTAPPSGATTLPPLRSAGAPAPAPAIPTLTVAEALDPQHPQSRAYGDGHTARADAAVRALPLFGALEAHAKTLAPTNAPVRHSLSGLELWVQQGQLMLAGKSGQADRVVFDPKTQAAPESGIVGMTVSADGASIAVATAVRGDDWQTWHVVDAQTGAARMEPITTKHIGDNGSGLQFAPDGQSVLFPERLAQARDDAGEHHIRYVRHVFGTAHAENTVVFDERDGAEDQYNFQLTERTEGGQPAIYFARRQGAAEVPLVFGRETENADGSKTRMHLVEPGKHFGKVVSLGVDNAVVRTSALGDTYGLQRIDLRTGEASTLVPARADATLLWTHPVGEHLLGAYLSTSQENTLAVFSRDGALQREFRMSDFGLPDTGDITAPTGNETSTTSWFTYSRVDKAPETFELDTKTLDLKKLPRAAHPLDSMTFESKLQWVDSDDGAARIPLHTFRRTDVAPADVTAVLAYGRIGIALPPHFNPQLNLMMAGGATVVVAGVRGGGEFGLASQRAAKDPMKSLADRETVARHLKEQGGPDHKVALLGRSFGGTYALAHLAHFPGTAVDLHVAAVPVADVEHWLTRGSGGWGWDDFFPPRHDDGSIAPPDAATQHGLDTLSFLKNVKKLKAPPNLFIAGGWADSRVDPVQALAAMAALEQKFGRAALKNTHLWMHPGGHANRGEAVHVASLVLNLANVTSLPASS